MKCNNRHLCMRRFIPDEAFSPLVRITSIMPVVGLEHQSGPLRDTEGLPVTSIQRPMGDASHVRLLTDPGNRAVPLLQVQYRCGGSSAGLKSH